MNEIKEGSCLREEKQGSVMKTKDDIQTAIDEQIRLWSAGRPGYTAGYCKEMVYVLQLLSTMTRRSKLFDAPAGWNYVIEVRGVGISLMIEETERSYEKNQPETECEAFELFQAGAELLTVEEYAKALEISHVASVTRIRRGKIRCAVKQGKEWRIPALALPVTRGYRPATYTWMGRLQGLPEKYEVINQYSRADFYQDDSSLARFHVKFTGGKFNYFYGSQADQFSFIRIPKIMLTDSAFQALSLGAKVLYGVLLDRMNLSMKNGWLDEEKRVFIIYQIGDIQEDLGFSRKKAMDLLTELERFGLLQKKRRGHGLPNILYVKNFMAETESRSSEMVTSGLSEPVSRSAEIHTREVTKPALQEVPDRAPLKNKTNINNTYKSETESNLILSTEKPSGDDAMRRDENKTTDNSGARAKVYEQTIRENICYDDLLTAHADDRELIEGIKDLILETVVGMRTEILISSTRYPAEVVRSKFLKLNYFHIEYVLHCLRQNTTKVKNIRKYMLAALFNAPSTMDGYYQAEVNHDMPQYAIAR